MQAASGAAAFGQGCGKSGTVAGPVDGPAIFTNCQSSQVTVACQQFQAKSCQDIEFGKHSTLYRRSLQICL